VKRLNVKAACVFPHLKIITQPGQLPEPNICDRA